MKTISSLQNSQIKKIIKLRKTSARRKADMVVVEGYKELSLASQSGVKIESLFIAHEFNELKNLPDREIGTDTFLLTPQVFKKLSMRENPDGFLGLIKPKQISLANLSTKKPSLVIVLESVEKPGNLGGILRTADAAGVDAVILSDLKTDIYNPSVIRASLGTVFTDQIAIGSNDEVLKWLKEKGIRVVATTPSTENYYTDVDMTSDITFIIGTEHSGLSDFWLKSSDNKVKIPMAGKIDSLNASVSTALVVFEAVRQRKFDI